jgi:hypothetical protein
MWVPINHPKELQREPQSVKATKSVAGKWKQTSDCFGTVRTKTIATANNGEQLTTTAAATQQQQQPTQEQYDKNRRSAGMIRDRDSLAEAKKCVLQSTSSN